MLEVSKAAVVGAKLCSEPLPRNKALHSQVAHPVGEPGVDVEGEGRAFKSFQRASVDRYRVGDELVVEVRAKNDDRVPERPLLGISRRPPQPVLLGNREADACRVALRLVGVATADRGGEEPMELVAEARCCAALPGDRREPELVHEAREGGTKLDLAAAASNGFGREPGEG